MVWVVGVLMSSYVMVYLVAILESVQYSSSDHHTWSQPGL